ncbi:MAG: 1,4-alpha-glucan-branching enzyme, partial [Bacteroidaceae bacterium]|nr:1,4-alpha-glucan-branching enzyme [Bacteroidaceae bacterium]
MATTTKTSAKSASKPSAKKSSAKKMTKKEQAAAAKAKAQKAQEPQMLKILRNDAYLRDFSAAIEGRHQAVLNKMDELTQHGKQTLSDFASGYLYFGLHRNDKGWVIREWAPNATEMYLIGDCNDWKENEKYAFKRVRGTDNWELKLGPRGLKHGELYKLSVHWDGGQGERIPAWCRRVVQDDQTKIFSAQVWAPKNEYEWQNLKFKPNTSPLLIYECHIGMSQDAEKVGTYEEFRQNVLPRVAKAGYNCIQIMAIQEHPYYGSFGYHVSNFFAPSSRFGTPEELKALIDDAHGRGIAVVMDIVHSHAVKNENEGLGNMCGDPCQYFYPGDRREHPAWDSLCFDYGKNQVLHFLLSNCKYWLDEFHFDGFRFDGVTSMLYYSHGLGEAFGSYADYYNGHEDDNAIVYLTLANVLIHQVNKNAITIAEEVSGMPGLAAPFEDGGYGFNYRLAMNIPDYWIKVIKELRDEDWKPSSLLWETTNRR